MSKGTRCTPENFAEVLGKAIQQYSDEVVKAMPDAVKTAAKKGLKALKSNASSIGGTRYKNSFKIKKTQSSSGMTEYTIFSTHYRVAHLLEKSHPMRNQTGRFFGMSTPREHWRPAEEAAIEALEEEIQKKVEEAE